MTITVPSVPFELTARGDSTWERDPASGRLTTVATPHSDIFIDPGGAQLNAESLLNASTLTGQPPDGDFQLVARVSVDFQAKFDAGVLLLWIDDHNWAKLCFEYSPDGVPMVVSVVGRGVADDANAFEVNQDHVWLRVSRIDGAFAFHASLDGDRWVFVRFFALALPAADAAVGFEAQSPVGEGCRVVFDDIRFTTERLGDLRDGT